MRRKLELADIEWDENGQPYSKQFSDVYYYQSTTASSQHNGLNESRYVFLQQNQLAERWLQLFDQNNIQTSQCFVIGETGFGTGLNFLAAWELWDNTASQANPNNTHALHYISVEKHPLDYSQLKRALSLWPTLARYSQNLLQHYPRLLAPGFFNVQFPDSSVHLTLIFDDAVEGLKQCLQSQHPNFRWPFSKGIDAWFLDGFAPRCNPQMWNTVLFETLAALSHQQTTLATFTAVGEVQRLLKSNGFGVEKVPGYAHKREMIRAHFLSPTKEIQHFTTSSHSSPHPLPWPVRPVTIYDHNSQKNKTVIIVGAGLAGCHTARELAEKGWQVKLVDRSEKVGQGASGNAHGIVYAKLSVDDDALAQFNLSALLTAEQCYQYWWQQDPNIGGNCGVMQLAYNEKEQQLWQSCRDYFSSEEDQHSSALFLNSHQASKIAGVDIRFNACFFPKLGWVNPTLLCQLLIDHPQISFQGQTEITQLKTTDDAWEVIDKQGNIFVKASCVVVANAASALSFEQTEQLPLKNIRGQVNYLQSTQTFQQLKTVVCAEGYITPVTNLPIAQSFGASFKLHQHDLQLRTEDSQSNLENLRSILPGEQTQLDTIDASRLGGRCGFRCTTPDYLPIVGPVHSHQRFIEDYSLLRNNANASLHSPGQYWPGLYINVGHGSRGLAYTPLSARLLAAQINGDPLPVSRYLADALHPGRFTIRGLIRRQL